MIKLPFRKLQIWQKGVDLSYDLYKLTSSFPREEVYGLVSQIRRAGVSISSNIAEGSQRNSDKDFARFILISKGSLAEIETQLVISQKLNYLTNKKYDSFLLKIDELHRMLHSFHVKLTTHC